MTDRQRVGITGVGLIGNMHAHADRNAGGVLAAVPAATPSPAKADAQPPQAERTYSSEELLTAVAGRPPDGLPTAAHGLHAARLITAVPESAATNSWTAGVEVPK